jgi:LacI family transcriptional regulator/LacI family purine nucleotide synthesis repressor
MEAMLEMPKLLAEQRADGFIIIGKLPEDYLNRLVGYTDVPMVYMDFSDEKKQADAVVSDNFYGAYHMTNYLFSMGHTRIAYVGTLLATSSITDRYLGYVKSLLEHGVSVRGDWQIDDRYMATGYIDDENLIQLPEDMPTAFFCNCDLTAGRLISKLERAGYRVPEDVSVVGYDNYIQPGLCDVEITTYAVDFKAMAKKAVGTLLKKMSSETNSYGVHIVEGHLVIKKSVKKI